MLHPRHFAVVLGLLLHSSPAASEPSIWSMARHPVLKANEELYRQVERQLAQRHLPTVSGSLGKKLDKANRWKQLRATRQMLERGKATKSGDPRLLYQLAQVHHQLFAANQDRKHLRLAIPLYLETIRLSQSSSRRAEAWNDLAICYARLDKHDPEVDAYREALLLEPHAETRAILLANQAEGFMVRGELSKAVRGYRKSLRRTPGSVMHRIAVTTLWGLAVALDRTGDLAGALEQIVLARSYDPSDRAINGPSWFYVPPYDAYWYAALGHWSRARQANSKASRLQSYRRAINAWSRYIDRAPSNDRWLFLASTRLEQCEKERGQALERSRP